MMNFLIIIILLIKLANTLSFVQIKNAQIHGFTKEVLGKKLNVFLGIPFAQPPVGNLRFEKPRPFKLTGKIDATKWPRPCWQPENSVLNLANKNYSEDCLYLNIWAPTSKHLKSVLVWLHGGGLAVGSSNDLTYEGDVLASCGDVVVVSVSYRLNVFGFLFADDEQIPGNVGLYDQLLAFKWVQNNIHYFGGDPKRVTIIGESGGAAAVASHFLSPQSRDHFNNAIVQSSYLSLYNTTKNRAEAVSISLSVAKQVECASSWVTSFNQKIIKCLKMLPPQKFFQNLEDQIFRLIVHGTKFLPKKPGEMLLEGDYKKKSQLLIGNTENESIEFEIESEIEMPGYSREDARIVINNVKEFAPFNTNQLYKFYISTIPDGHEDALRKATMIMYGDNSISCPTIDFGRFVFENDKKSRVFEYYYTYKHSLELLEELHLSFTDLCKPYKGACHTFDLVSLFGWPLKRPDKFSKREKQLSKRMIKTVACFSKSGRPAKVKGVKWPAFYSVPFISVNGTEITYNTTAMPYYEFARKERPEGNFGWNLKEFECQDLFRKLIEPLM